MNSYTVLQDIFKNVFEHLKYAELKNGVFLSLQIGIFYFTINNLQIEYKLWLVSLMIINIFITLFSFFPHLDNYTFLYSKSTAKKNNIFFFEDIKNFDEKSYMNTTLDILGEPEYKDSVLHQNISNQIITLSKITSNKFKLFKFSFFIFLFIGFFTTTIKLGGSL